MIAKVRDLALMLHLLRFYVMHGSITSSRFGAVVCLRWSGSYDSSSRGTCCLLSPRPSSCLLNQAGRVVPKHFGGVGFATSQTTRPSGSNPDPSRRHPKSNVREQRSGLHGCKANSPLEGVSPRIICRVLNVWLKASETDRVYAWMLLEPKLNDDSELIDDKRPMMPRHPAPYFCKKLGAADTVAHAWLSIPRKHAEKCLPQLDMTQMAPMQVLVAKDLSGKEWRFQHRLVGQMRHRLQTAEFATSNNLVAGDGIVILRGQDGDLRVGTRRSMRQIRNVSAPEMPNDEGCETGISILQSISHAVTTRSKFTVLYKPTTGTDQFVVSCNRYDESTKIYYYTGMRFKMISSREAAMKDRVSGTILGTEEFDEAWPGSNWKCLKVKWDKESPVAIINNVSPWEIEPYKRSSSCILSGTETKRTRCQKVSQREYRRQRAETCLNKAKRVLQLYHDESMKQEPSIAENKIYLSAVDDLIDLSRDSSFSGPSAAADDVRKQAQAALDIEMSNLETTLYGLKLWNTSHFEDLDNSPHFQGAVIKLNSLLALDGPCLSSTSSEPTSLSSNSTGVSSRDSDLMPAEDCTTLHNVISCLEEKKVDLINTESVKVIESIASRMIKAGYKERLRKTFTDLSKELIRDFRVLDFSWNFGGHGKVDEGDSRHGEDISLQYWNSASQLMTRVLLEMQRQLNEQNFGAFEELKKDYFAKIMEQPILKLLNDASMSAALHGLLEEVPHGSVKCLSSNFLRIGHALSTHKTLTDVEELVLPECRGSVWIKAEAIRESVEEVVTRMLYSLTNVIKAEAIRESAEETEGSDIHPVARAVVKGIGLLSQHRESLNLILARNCCQTLVGICSTKSFACLISNLMMRLGSALEQSSKHLVHRELQYLFLSNNLQFILQQVKNAVPKEPIEYDWAEWYEEQIEHYVKEYIETSWAPVSSHLADMDRKHFSLLKPSCVQHFTTAFQSVYDIQRHWKVPDPRLREKLRLSVSQKIVPLYSEYLKKHPKDERSVRITAKVLEDLLAELFEG